MDHVLVLEMRIPTGRSSVKLSRQFHLACLRGLAALLALTPSQSSCEDRMSEIQTPGTCHIWVGTDSVATWAHFWAIRLFCFFLIFINSLLT